HIGKFLLNIPLDIQIRKSNSILTLETITNYQVLTTFFVLIKNLFKSFTKLHTLRLFLKGIGFRVNSENTQINFKIGFSNPIMYTKKNIIEYNIYKNYFIDIKSPLKDKLGYEAFLISKLKTPDVYKAKGIHTKGLLIKTKIG